MKKLLSLCLAVLLCLPCLYLAACSESAFDYQNEDLTAMVTVPGTYRTDKLAIKVKDLAALITDEELFEAIDELIALVGHDMYYEKITEGDIHVGDTLGLAYKGVLLEKITDANGDALYTTVDAEGKDLSSEEIATKLAAVKAYIATLTDEQIKALTGFDNGEVTEDKITKDTELQVGSGAFVDGFEDAILEEGIKLGDKNKPIYVTFPSDFKTSTLAGKAAVFFLSPVYKWQMIEERDLKKGDGVNITYRTEPDSEEAYNKLHAETENGVTYESAVSHFKSTSDTWVENDKHEIITIGTDPAWYYDLMAAFNALKSEDGRFGVSLTFTSNVNVRWTEDVEGETDKKSVETSLPVKFTVTVWSIDAIRTFPADGGIVDAEEAGAHQITYKSFCEKLESASSSNAIDTEKYPTYAEYKTSLKAQLQTVRDVQISANLYHATFDALVALSTVDYNNETVKRLISAYKDEVQENVDAFIVQLNASGLSTYYSYLAKSAGYSTVEDYYMSSAYGATAATLDTVAKKAITEKLVFWQAVKNENIAISADEYTAGVAQYKDQWADLGQDVDFDELEESDIREALLWDKLCKYLSDNYVTVTRVDLDED